MHTAIDLILTAHGFRDDFLHSDFFHLRIDNPPYMTLVIERIGSMRVSVAHYIIQNGDMCQDPEMTWCMSSGDAALTQKWTPATFTQTLMGIYQDAFPVIEGRTHINTRLTRELRQFAMLWARNLLTQGFHDPRCTVTSRSHPRIESSSITTGARP